MATSFLRTNITSLLALFWSVLAGVLFVLVLIGQVRADEKIVYFVLGALVNQVAQVLSYYFGASKTPIDQRATTTISTTIKEPEKPIE